MYYNYNRKTTRHWMNDNRRPKELRQINVDYVRECNQLKTEFSRVIVIAYFLRVELGMEDVATILNSLLKQKKFIIALKLSLKERGVTPEWHKIFEYDFNSMHRRCRYVFAIMKENVRLTEYYPYFMNVGFERLLSFDSKNDDLEEWERQLKQEISEYTAQHPDEVAKHMESVRIEKENIERHKAEVKEKERLEKEARRLARKLETQEVNEIKKNARAHASKERMINRSFEKYWS